MSANIFIYSKKCDASMELIKMMETENLLRFFHVVCVDDRKIPEHLAITPTIVIKGIPTPYSGSNAFAWLSRIKQWKINLTMQKASQTQQQNFQIFGTTNDNIQGFSNAEMNALSDIFTSIDPNNTNAAPQAYVNVSDMGKDSIFTPPLENGSYKISKDGKHKPKINDIKDLHSKIEQERKKQDEHFKNQLGNYIKQLKKN